MDSTFIEIYFKIGYDIRSLNLQDKIECPEHYRKELIRVIHDCYTFKFSLQDTPFGRFRCVFPCYNDNDDDNNNDNNRLDDSYYHDKVSIRIENNADNNIKGILNYIKENIKCLMNMYHTSVSHSNIGAIKLGDVIYYGKAEYYPYPIDSIKDPGYD